MLEILLGGIGLSESEVEWMSLQACQLAVDGYESRRREDFEMLAKMLGVEMKEQTPDLTPEEREELNAAAIKAVTKRMNKEAA